MEGFAYFPHTREDIDLMLRRIGAKDLDALYSDVPQEFIYQGEYDLPEAMIREVHVYGRVAGLGTSERGVAQHAGLGRQLVEEACRQARQEGFGAINVISSVGTRNYYRKLGFVDAGLYQRRELA